MAKRTREDWAKQIERWKDSGLTAAEFAAETGINADSLTWWRWKLSADARSRETATTPSPTVPASDVEPTISQRKPRRRRRRSKAVATDTMTFVELTRPQHSDALEVVLVSGRHIRVPVGFDTPTFERLLAILDRSA